MTRSPRFIPTSDHDIRALAAIAMEQAVEGIAEGDDSLEAMLGLSMLLTDQRVVIYAMLCARNALRLCFGSFPEDAVDTPGGAATIKARAAEIAALLRGADSKVDS